MPPNREAFFFTNAVTILSLPIVCCSLRLRNTPLQSGSHFDRVNQCHLFYRVRSL
jgi:hypothetical protein